jgi:hypothetical protein
LLCEISYAFDKLPFPIIVGIFERERERERDP